MTIDVRPIQPQEWQVYRELRLQALRDSPDAFGSTYEAEVTRPTESWSARIEAAVASGSDHVLLAFNHHEASGLVWCKLAVSAPEVADIFQMWVAPSARCLGAGQALLRAALDWAASVNAQRVRLGVTATNSPAMRLYRAHGFRPIGALAPLREGTCLMVQAMELEL